MTILVTGGAGFIGSNLLHELVDTYEGDVVCVDALTYAANPTHIPEGVLLYPYDISDKDQVDEVFAAYKPKYVFHLAAESHVDNSIKDCSPFIQSNIIGTVNLLNAALKYNVEKFMHISTDEVYGSIEEGSFTEDTIYDPRNPYSASKASSDHFVMAYHNTYGLPALITNCSNNYGPRQYKEKMIPKIIMNLMDDKKIPVYGQGEQIRDWLYVKDHCEALIKVWREGKVGEKYNIGGECEVKNIDLVKRIISIMQKDESMIEFVEDRPGHDFRYSTDITKIRNTLGWSPRFTFDQAIIETIEWYESNRNKLN
jgi:dTDP-glucose 4,6-dehydratase